MYRGTRKLVPLFYNTILQNAKEREQSQVYLNYAERRSISMMKYKNTKTQKCKTYRKLLIKYKIHFASFAKPLHFLCKKVFGGCWPLAFLGLGFIILEFRHKNKRTYL